jgi:ATP-dependent helicase HrpA
MTPSKRSNSSFRPAAPESQCLTADARRLLALQREMLRSAPEKRQKPQADFAALVAQSQAAVAARRGKLPKPEFQSDLPVNERRADIAELIAKNQVVIVCGETGSGKTTQLPKICLDLGIGARGLIGHTQPRRLAARSVATRLAQELKTQVGAGVGVKIRFHDKSTPESWVKLMTDGILLAESQSDPYLNAYEAIIIDEAHERSLNIDFLLGYLKQLLPKRPDLKLIITSATIDAERFSQHFNGAPVIEVSGRLYPVEVRYRPVVDINKKDDERDLYDAIVDAADELSRLGPATSWSSCPASGKSARRPKPCASTRWPGPACRRPMRRKSCRCSRACRPAIRTASSSPRAASGASCWRPMSPKPR